MEEINAIRLSRAQLEAWHNEVRCFALGAPLRWQRMCLPPFWLGCRPMHSACSCLVSLFSPSSFDMSLAVITLLADHAVLLLFSMILRPRVCCLRPALF